MRSNTSSCFGGAVLPGWRPLRRLAAVGLVLTGSLPAWAQRATPAGAPNPVVSSQSPARNSIAAVRSANVVINLNTFNAGLNPATAGKVRVFSAQRGGQLVRGGNVTVSGDIITVNPATDFNPGETLFLSVPPGVENSVGQAAMPYVAQFTAGVSASSPGTFGGGADLSLAASPLATAFGDLDGDGDLDLAAASANNTVAIRLNDGSGTFSGSGSVGVGPLPTRVLLGDVDDDGDLDIVTVNSAQAPPFTGSGLSVALNGGSGSFGAATNYPASDFAIEAALGDIDSDGDLDLVKADNDGGLNMLLNNGLGAFGTPTAISSIRAQGMKLGDVDNDGDLDIVVADYNSTLVRVFGNNGFATFSPAGTVSVGTGTFGAYRVGLADLDADGDLDLVANMINSNQLKISKNNGAGSFGTPVTVATATQEVFTFGDIDGDGDLDLVGNDERGGNSQVVVHRNDGSGNLGAATSVSVNGSNYGVALGDVDGDGDLDLASANNGTLTVSIRFNRVFVPAPTLTSLSPTSGQAGASVTLTGTAFTGTTGVSFNGTAATFTVVDATTITTTVPAGATTGNVIVTTPSGPSNGVNFTVEQDLVVTALNTPGGGLYHDVTVESGGSLVLSSDLTVMGTLTVRNGGALFANTAGGNCRTIDGAGNFVLEAGGLFSICDPLGITLSGATGQVQVTGSRSYSPQARYAYTRAGRRITGTSVTGNGLPAQVDALGINAPVNVLLSQPVAINHDLSLYGVGNLDVNGQSLTLLSSAVGTAFEHEYAAGKVLGTVTVQRYVGGPTTVSYRHLSAPVQNSTVADLATTGYAPRVTPAYNALPTPTLPTASFPSIFGYDETRGGTTAAFQSFNTGYYSPAALSSALTPGLGWSVLIKGGTTPDFVGTLASGSVPRSLSVTGLAGSGKRGWFLLGNPYAEAINWDLATIPAGLDAAVYVWYSTGGATGAYRTRVGGAGNLVNGEIGLGQGFFVHASAPTTFTFSNAMRVDESYGLGLGRAAQTAQPAPVRPSLTLTLTDARGQQDAVTVLARAGATASFDGAYDALRPGRNVGVPTLAALIDGQEGMVSALPAQVAQGQSATVELTAVLPTAGQYTLAVGALANFAGASVELLDRLTNTRYDLTTAPVVTLTATRDKAEVTGRFALVFNGQRVLGTAAQIAPLSRLTLFPNPNPAGTSVRVAGCLADASVTLFDLAGRRVASGMADATGTAEVSVRGLAAGVYSVRAADGRTTRLVVE